MTEVEVHPRTRIGKASSCQSSGLKDSDNGHPSIYQPNPLSLYSSIRPSLHSPPSLYPSIYLFLQPSLHPTTTLLPFYLSILPSVNPPITPYVTPSGNLSLHPSTLPRPTTSLSLKDGILQTSLSPSTIFF